MTKTLHILNGDATVAPFIGSQIPGDHIVWREVLSDGPINHPFNSTNFWVERETYMNEAFDIPEGDYRHSIMEPFQQMLESLTDYHEVCLWFEYDLFCQINMIALIGYLGQVKPEALQVTLVCAGKVDESEELKGLGELTAQNFVQLHKTRLKLGSREIDYAQEVFETYCQNEADALYNYVLMPFNEFEYLSDALESHMRRFPFSDSGLNEIESKIIELIHNGVNNEIQLVGQLLKWQKFYGFGDLQYFNILKGMKALFKNYEKLELLDGLDKISIESTLKRNTQLGGSWLDRWIYDIDEKTLIPRDQR